MDPYGAAGLPAADESARNAMSHTRNYATRMNLASMSPRGDLVSTGYALANPGSEYLVYQPESGAFTVNLVAGSYIYEWFNPAAGVVVDMGAMSAAAGKKSFTAPFTGHAVLYLTTAPTPTSMATPTATPASAPTPALARAPAPAAGLTFLATAGVISPPFTAENGILSQHLETSISDGGRASYSFNITAPGDYIVAADVNAPSERANSFFVNIDAEPTGRTMIWDALPTTLSIETRTVGWRGNGTSSAPEFPTKVFRLSAGTHTLIIRGLEAGVGLSAITIAPASTPAPSAPAAPQDLRVLSSE
jgi:hypothetical protein